MQVKKRYLFFGIVLAVLLFSGGYALAESSYAPVKLSGFSGSLSAESEEAFRPFWETLELIQEEYFEQPLDEQLLAKGAIDGMLATLNDLNTRYLPPEQEQAARDALDGNLHGIGAEVSSKDGDIIIVAPFEGSPAEDAGILPGDILRKANGESLTGLHPSDAAMLVRGPAGTPVLLVIERDGEMLEFEVIRGIIKIPSVRGELTEDNVAYIRLSRFANDTAGELENVIQKLLEGDPGGLILDLRGNPGGSLPTALNVADQFLADGTILVEQFGNGREIEFESGDDGDAQILPLVVLIDQGSASASEVVAGAIQDRDRGILIGESSFGKGTVQIWRKLSNGGGIRITVARWLTPNGAWVHEEGIDPDFLVLLPEFDGDEFVDTQLQAAVDYISGRPVVESESGNDG